MSTPSCSDQPLLFCAPHAPRTGSDGYQLSHLHLSTGILQPLFCFSPASPRTRVSQAAPQVCHLTELHQWSPAAAGSSCQGSFFLEARTSQALAQISRVVISTWFGSSMARPEECPLCLHCPPVPLMHSVYSG